MLIESGTVTQLETDNAGCQWVWINIQRKTACHGCETTGSCGTGALSEYFANRSQSLRLPSPGNLHVGQQIRIGIQESAMLQVSLLIYLLPLLLMFIGGVLGEILFPSLGEGAVLLAAGGGFALGFALLRRFPAQQARFQPVILSD